MWEEILTLVINNGLVPVLFVGLLVWVLRDSKTRENKYQEMLTKLQDTLAVVHDIEMITREIHDALCKKTNAG